MANDPLGPRQPDAGEWRRRSSPVDSEEVGGDSRPGRRMRDVGDINRVDLTGRPRFIQVMNNRHDRTGVRQPLAFLKVKAVSPGQEIPVDPSQFGVLKRRWR